MLVSNKLYKQFAQNFPIICVDGIIVQNGKYLLVKRQNEPLKEEWWIPGGRLYKDETLEKGFRRKIKEETGLDVRVVARIGFYEESFKLNDLGIDSKHTISIVFIATPIDPSQKIKLDKQSSEYKWADYLPKRFKKQVFKLGQ